MLDVNRLRVLHEVARTGSFSAAARVLAISPSAVSQQIAALERSVGLPVVTRSPRGVCITEPGRLLTEVTSDLVAGLEQVERRLASYAEGLAGRLAVATFPSAGQSLLPRALAPITSRPDVEITVTEAEPEHALPLVRDGAVDLAVVYHFFTATPPYEWHDLVHTPLLEEQMAVVVPEGHPLVGSSPVPLSALADDAWVLGVGACGGQLDQLFLAAGFEPRAACRSGDYAFAKTLVAGGVGVALVPELALTPAVAGTAVVQLAEPPIRHVGVVQRAGAGQPPLGEELTRRLGEAAVASVSR